MSVGAGHALPILDLRDLDADGDAPARFRGTLRDALHEVGFLDLTGHGVPNEVIAGAFAEAQRFFALPLEDEASVQMLRSPHFRGYTRTRGRAACAPTPTSPRPTTPT